MNESSDQQYQQQQLEQLKLETSQISFDTTDDKSWTQQGINQNIVQKIRSCIENGRTTKLSFIEIINFYYFYLGKLTSFDIDHRVCEQLQSFPDDITSIDSLFNEFNNSDLTGVVNKSAFLCNLIKQWKIKNPQQQKTSNNDAQGFGDLPGTNKPGPDQAKLKVKISLFNL